jgi:site-specific DNA-methyltransferase (adenine-specific)
MYSIYDQINNRKVLVYPERTTVEAKTTDSVVLTNAQIASTYFPEDIDVKPEIYFDKVEIGEGNYIFHGDNIQVLRTLLDNSVDSVVTDPPYGLKFMGKKWDYDVPSVELWKEVYRVLKPGGYLLSFGSSRTYHRMVIKVEDAGFEIRDQIMWIYGSGFPKSHNLGLSIDKLSGGTPVIIGTKRSGISKAFTKEGWGSGNDVVNVSKAETLIGQQWTGWGTNLKPAHEPILVARKPLSEKSIAKNVLKWNTGGINIDDCRVGEELITTNGFGTNGFVAGENYKPTSHIGRFPANIILDEEAGIILDLQSGITKSSKRSSKYNKKTEFTNTYTPTQSDYRDDNTYKDKGGASRFFYCPKPSKKERNEGMPIAIGEFSQRPRRDDGTVIYKETHLEEWTQVMSKLKRKDKTSKAAAEEKLQANSNGVKNNHPTIKPIKLMQYLIRLVTPKAGVTMDPYFGSGSSGKSTIREGNDYKFLGIEKEKEYFNIAVERCQYEYEQSLKVAA